MWWGLLERGVVELPSLAAPLFIGAFGQLS